MNVQETARLQNVRLADEAARQLRGLHRPKAGWLTLLRKALRMSGKDVADRMGVSRAAIYQAERNERDGAITIAQMRKIAEAMDAEFVYAVVPRSRVADVVETQARRKAEARVQRASSHMALEGQSLTNELTRQRVDALTERLAREQPPGFWHRE